MRAASDSGIQLGRLVAGSEGTLAVVLQAVLRTVPFPPAQGVVLLPFARFADAAAFVPELLEPGARGLVVRPVRPPVDQPGARRRSVVSRLDRRGGRGDPDRRI